jgi:hypothetical protein
MNHSLQKTSVAMTAIVVVALGIIVVGSTAVNAFLMITPVYAQLDISDQIIGGEEIPELEIPDSDDIREKIGEKITSQLPRLPEQASLLPIVRPPPALAI